jgi:hypothetical protein
VISLHSGIAERGVHQPNEHGGKRYLRSFYLVYNSLSYFLALCAGFYLVICPENSELSGLYVMGGQANTYRQTSGRYQLTQTRDGRWTINDTSILYARTSLPLGLPTEAPQWSCFIHNAYVEAPGTHITAVQDPKPGSSVSSMYNYRRTHCHQCDSFPVL